MLDRAVACILTVVVAAASAAPGAANPGRADSHSWNLFGSTEYVSQAPLQWFGVLQSLRQERELFAACATRPEACPSKALARWPAVLAPLRALPPLERLAALNAAVNESPYRADAENFGRDDYWALPSQFARFSGDCEDFVIFKLVALEYLGFVGDDLRVVLVRDILHHADHAVLAVRLEGEIYILDNVVSPVEPHHRIKRYVPVASFNTRRGWGHATVRAPERVDVVQPAGSRPR